MASRPQNEQEEGGNAEILAQAVARDRDPAASLLSVLEAVPAFIARVDAAFRIVYLNRVQPGLDLANVIGSDVFAYIAPADHAVARACFERVLATGTPDRYDAVALGANGRLAHYVSHVSPVRDSSGENGLCIVAMDLTEERERQRSLVERREELRLVIDATQLAMWDWDMVEDVVTWDDRMFAITGRDQPLGVDAFVTELVHPDDRAEARRNLERALAEGTLREGHVRIVRADGSVRYTVTNGIVIRDEAGNPVRFTGGMQDVTEQRLTDEHLRRAQKAEVIGTLTAGIAHNFNNMLMIVMPSLDVVMDVVPGSHRQIVEDARLAASRAARTVQQLMAYSGQRRVGKREAFRPAEIVERCVSTCPQSFDPAIAIDVTVADVDVVWCDDSEIHQAVMNVLANARDAVVDAKTRDPRIDVRIARAPAAGLAPPHGTGEIVAVSIHDNGPGIPPQIRERIFEPFFTTKQSTGLGLATTSAILREHGGWIACASTPEDGTTFSLFLPCTGAAPPKSKAGERA